MALMHQSARWLDEPTKPFGNYRYVDRLSVGQWVGVVVGVGVGAGAAWMSPSGLGFLRLSIGLIVAVFVGFLLVYLASGRKEPYARQVCGCMTRASVRAMRVYAKRPSVVRTPTIDDAGIVDDED